MHRSSWILGGIGSFLLALVISGVGGCNIHELGHLVTGRLAGVPVNDIMWCAPANGRIVFAYQEPAWVGYAGGITAAVVLVLIYVAIIRSRLESFYWWMVGVAVLGTAISQVIVGVMEGSDPIRYAGSQDSAVGLVLLLAVPLVVAAAIQLKVQKPAGPRTNRPEKRSAL